MISSRRRFFFGAAASLIAAPAIVRVASMMDFGAARLVRINLYHMYATGPFGSETWTQSLHGWFRTEGDALHAMHLPPDATLTGHSIAGTKLVSI